MTYVNINIIYDSGFVAIFL